MKGGKLAFRHLGWVVESFDLWKALKTPVPSSPRHPFSPSSVQSPGCEMILKSQILIVSALFVYSELVILMPLVFELL